MKKLSLLLLVSVLFSISVFSQKGEYKIEKGIIHYTMQFMGMEFETVTYFKNHGAVEVVESTVEMMGISTTTRNITIGEYIYSLDMIEKKGTKIKITEDNEFDVKKKDFDNFTPEEEEEYEIIEIENKKVAGKDCKGFSMKIEGADNKFYVWKNIPLEYEVETTNATILMKATKVDDNPTFPKGIFEIPKDFEITEIEY